MNNSGDFENLEWLKYEDDFPSSCYPSESYDSDIEKM